MELRADLVEAEVGIVARDVGVDQQLMHEMGPRRRRRDRENHDLLGHEYTDGIFEATRGFCEQADTCVEFTPVKARPPPLPHPFGAESLADEPE